MLRDGVFASRRRRDDRALWTIVNRNDYAVTGPMIKVTADKAAKYIDLYHGVEIEPVQIGDSSVLEIAGDVDPAARALMPRRQRSLISC
jgi:hypothetical protein